MAIHTSSDIIAQRYVVSSSVSHYTSSAASGSTISGDSAEDKHQFTGSLSVKTLASTADFVVTGSQVGVGIAAPAQPLHVFSSGNGGLEIDATGGAPTLFFDVPGNEQGRIYFQEDDTVMGGIVYESTGTDYISFKLESNTERMRLLGSEKLTIGTNFNNNSGVLNIAPSSGTAPTMYFEQYASATDGTLGEISFGNRAVDGQLALIQVKNDGANDSAYMAFHTEVTSGALTERLRINSSGKVGIGITTPTTALQVEGAISSSGDIQTDGEVKFYDNAVFGGRIKYIDSSNLLSIQANEVSGDGVEIFGNDYTYIGTADDNHLLTIEGNNKISGSAASTGSFGALAIGTSGPGGERKVDIRGEMMVQSPGGESRHYFSGAAADGDDGQYYIYNDSAAIKVKLNSDGDSYFTGGDVGIGTTGPDRLLHVHKASAGSVTAVSYTELVVEDDGGSGISILAPDANSGNIVFGFPSDNDSIQLRAYYNSGNPRLAVELAASEKFNFIGNQFSGSAVSTGSFGRLIADGANDSRVGIGTASPVRSLDIYDGGANGFINLRDSTKALDIGTSTHDMVRFYEGGDVRMTISGSNVGIGVQTPDSKLEVNGTDLIGNFAGSNAGFYIRNNTPNYISFQGYGDDGFIFKDGGNERIRFESGGNVGIGETSPQTKLHILESSAAPALTIDQSTQQQYSGLRIRTNRGDAGSYDGNWDIFDHGGGYLRFAYGLVDSSTYGNLLAGADIRLAIDGSSGNVEFPTANAKISGSSTSTGSFGSAHIAHKVGIGTTGPGTVLPSGWSGNRLLEIRASSSGGDAGLFLRRFEGDGTYGMDFWTDTNSADNYIDSRGGISASELFIRVATHTSPINAARFDYLGNVEFPSATSISGSSTSTGSFGHGFFGGNVNIEASSSLIFTPPVYTGAVQGIKFDDGGAIDAIIQPARLASNQGIIIYLGANSFVNTSGGTDRYSDSSASSGIEIRPDNGQIRFLTNTSAADPLSRMAINSDGKVGIGTDSPESILHIADGSSGAIGAKLIIDNDVSDADGNGTEISFFNAAGASAAGVANSRIRSVASGNTNGYSQLQFWTYHASEAQRMVITSDGKIGIGTASPSKTFHAYANVSSDYAALVENDQATSGHGLQIHSDGNGTGTILFDVDAAGSSRFRVRGDGSVLVGFTTSQAEKLAVNGDFRATGNISGSSTSTGSFGVLKLASYNQGYGHSTNTFLGINVGDAPVTGHSNVGIGANSLGAATDVDFAIAIGNATLGGGNVTSDADGAIAIGAYALNALTTGRYNTAIGYEALLIAAELDKNTAIGYQALKAMSGSSADPDFGNTAVGYQAGLAVTTGMNNTIVGTNAGDAITTGNSNVLMGRNAGGAIIDGSNNICFGVGAGDAITDGTYNIAIGGNNAGGAIVGGDGNIAIGGSALEQNQTGDYCIGIGYNAGQQNTGADYNIAIGYAANDLTGPGNVGIGRYALSGASTGEYNVGIGYDVGAALSTGDNNVFIGKNAAGSTTDVDNAVIIGSSAGASNMTSAADGTVAIGTSAGANITSGIGNTAVGYGALYGEDDGDYNTAMGYAALNSQTGTSGEVANTAMGYRSGYAVTTGIRNTYIGSNSGEYASGSAADDNVGLGYKSLTALTSGSRNTVLGAWAGLQFHNASDIVALGHYTLANAIASTDIDGCVAIGSWAQAENKTGIGNVSVGFRALQQDVNGDYSTAIGHEAHYSQNGTSGLVANTGVGYRAGYHNTSGIKNTYIGYHSGLGVSSNANSSNTGVGYRSLFAVTTGGSNVALGESAGSGITTASGSVIIGMDTGNTITTGNMNIAIGHDAMSGGTVTGDNNIAIGKSAGDALTSGYQNVLLGGEAGGAINSGYLNTAIGHEAGKAITTGIANTILGWQAGSGLQTGHNNVFIGREAGKGVTTTVQNIIAIGHGSAVGVMTTAANASVFIGASAGAAVTSGAANVAVGYQTGKNLTDGGNNVLIGQGANSDGGTAASQNIGIGVNALLNAEGSNNVAIGYAAGDLITTGNQNILIGRSTDVSANSGANQTVIGYNATGQGDDTVVLGNSSVTDIYMSEDAGATIRAAGPKYADSGKKYYKAVGSISLTAGSATDFMVTGHSHNYIIQVWCDSGSDGITSTKSLQAVYGASNQIDIHEKQFGSGTTDITFAYVNSGGTSNYMYTVTAASVNCTMYYVIEGLGSQTLTFF